MHLIKFASGHHAFAPTEFGEEVGEGERVHLNAL